MSLFWHLMIASFSVDFILNTKWFEKNREHIIAYVVNALVFLFLSIIVLHEVIFDDPAIPVTIVILAIIRFFAGLLTRFIAKGNFDRIFVFLSDQFIKIATILTCCAFFFLNLFPATGMIRVPMIALSIFAIWGVPILVNIIDKQYRSIELNDDQLLFEKRSIPSLLERAAIYVGISLGGWFYFLLIMPFIVRGISIRIRDDLHFPYITWIVVGVVALFTRIIATLIGG